MHPHHVSCTKGRWYLAAYDVNRKVIRTFALTRIEKLSIKNGTSKPQPAFTALPFLRFRGHPDEGQRVRIARHMTVQGGEYRQRVGVVGLHPLVLVVPVARADDIIGRAQGGELPIQAVMTSIAPVDAL